MLTRRVFGLSLAAAGLAGTASAQTAEQLPFYPNHPQYAAALALLSGNKWADLVALVSALPPSSAVVLLDDLGDSSPLRDNLDALARVRGGKTVAGAIQIDWGWRYRGSTTTIVNEDAFGRQLARALELLSQAIRDDPNDGVAAMYLMRCLKGAGMRDELLALLPVYLLASRKPVQGLAQYADGVSAKWGGSDEECLAFARRYANSAPPASYGVIADTHMTVSGSRAMSDDEQVRASAPGYFRQPDVAAEIIAASDHFLAAPADSDNFAMLFAHAEFSFAFLSMRDEPHLRTHLAAQGDFTGSYWRYVPQPRAMLLRLRAALGLTAT